jgi:hypothetical protein
MNKRSRIALFGFFSISIPLILINLLTTPRILWSFIPAFGVLWWPMAVFLGKKRKALSIAGSAHIIILLAGINLIFSPRVNWAFIPCFAVLWWPIAAYLGRKKKTLSIIGSLHIIAFLIGINALFSPGYPWAVFAIFPILWWPISIFSGEKAKTVPFAIISAIILTGYYVILNIFVEPRHPFWIYIAYGLAWWPLSLAYRGKISRKVIAVISLVANIAFILYFSQIIRPEYNWSIYLLGPAVLLSVMLFVGEKCKTLAFSILAYIALLAYYGYLNIFIENGHPFIIYIAFAFAWWPISLSYVRHKNPLRFSLVSFFLIAAFFTATNLVTTPQVLWAVYPIGAAAFWPLSMLVFGGKNKKEKQLTAQ